MYNIRSESDKSVHIPYITTSIFFFLSEVHNVFRSDVMDEYFHLPTLRYISV